MKKLLIVCAFVMGVSTVSLAQGGGRRGLAPADQVAAWKTSLSLTDDQSAKILPILTAQAKSRDSIMTAANGDFASARPAFTALQTTTATKVKAVLTADQAAIYQKQLDEMAARRRQQQGN